MGVLELPLPDDPRWAELAGDHPVADLHAALAKLDTGPRDAAAWAAVDATVLAAPGVAYGALAWLVMLALGSPDKARYALWETGARWVRAVHGQPTPEAFRIPFYAARRRAAGSLVGDLLDAPFAPSKLLVYLEAIAIYKGAPVPPGLLARLHVAPLGVACPHCQAPIWLVADDDELAVIGTAPGESVPDDAIRTLVKPWSPKAGRSATSVDLDEDPPPAWLSAMARVHGRDDLAAASRWLYGRAACPACFEAFDMSRVLLDDPT